MYSIEKKMMTEKIALKSKMYTVEPACVCVCDRERARERKKLGYF